MRNLIKSYQKFKRRHNVFLLCLFVLALLCVLTAGKAYAAADTTNNIYWIEDSQITDLKLQYKDWEGNWYDVTESHPHTFGKNDAIGFSMAYKIPAYAMKELTENAKIQYQVQGITEGNALLGSSGPVYAPNSTVQVGTYTISTSGLITIELNTDAGKDQITKNRNGEAIDQTVHFSAEATKLIGDNAESKLITIGARTVTVQFQPDTGSAKDLHVQKKAGEIDENGKINYTIDVSSNNGTNDVVTITDTITGGTLEINDQNDIQVQKVVSSGNAETISPTSFTVDDNKTSFSLTLSQMDAGTHYYIIYKGKIGTVDQATGKASDVQNKVVAQSKGDSNTELKPETSTNTQVSMISKSADYQWSGNENDMITWTIKINSLGNNLNGYTISDDYYGEEITNIKMVDSDGNETPINQFPYTFGDTRKNYTITYTVPAMRNVGSAQSINTATLKTPQNKTYTDTPDNVWIGDFNPLSKQATRTYKQGENVNIQWKVTINADKGKILPDENGWTYTDTFENGQYFQFTAWGDNSISGFKNGIIEAFKNADISLNEKDIQFINTGDKYTGFTITCRSQIPKGKSISFKYTATAPLSNGPEYINQGNLETKYGNQTVREKGTYHPLVQKFDARNENATGATTHDYYDAALSDDGNSNSTGAGILKWKIRLYIPDGTTDKITLTDTLPNDVDFYEGTNTHALTVKMPNNNEQAFTTFDKDGNNHVSDNATASVTIQSQTIKTTYNQTTRTVAWEIPAELAQQFQNQAIDFYIAAQVQANSIPGLTDTGYQSKDFENSVNAKIGNGDSLTATQKQTISKDDRYDALTKNGKREHNYLTYTVEINPKGKTYLPSGNTLTIQDVLTYQTYSPDVSAALLLSSIHLYKVGENDEKIPIDNNLTYTIDQKMEKKQYENVYIHTATIEATVPDGEHLYLEYTYKASGEQQQYVFNISNTATLKGIMTTNKAKHWEDPFSISNSDATSANETGVVIHKHAYGNVNEKLPGAHFKLEKYTGDSATYIDTNYESVHEYETESNGEINLKGLEYNKPYRLTETKAPDGYLIDRTPYYFYIIPDSSSDTHNVLPSGFRGTGYHNGQDLLRPNRTMNDKTDITVTKHWLDKGGQEKTAPKGSEVTLKLHQVEKPFDANVKFYTSYNKDITNELDPSFAPLTGGHYPYGTELAIQFTYDNYDTPKLTIYKEDGTLLPISETIENSKKTYALIPFTVESDMNWTVFFDGADYKKLNAEVVKSGNPQKRFDNLYPKQDEPMTVKLNADDINWTKTIDNLPLHGVENIAGTPTEVAYAYYVEETPVPAGYTVSYSDNQSGVTQGTIGVFNQENDTQINVKKVWKDAAGNPENNHTEDVTVNIKRQLVNSNGEAVSGTTPETVNTLFREAGSTDNSALTLNSQNNYALSNIQKPPATGEYNNMTYSYKYYAEEVSSISGYSSEVTVESNEEQENGFPKRFPVTITVTNTSENNALTLPSTGSMGLWVMMALGLGLMGGGAYLYKRKTGQKQKKPKDTSSGESG